MSDIETAPQQICVEPWPDPVIDQLGHDPRSPYVERFWLGILGPSTLWLLRRLAYEFDDHPEGFALDIDETAKALGVGMRGGRNSPFVRSLERGTHFGVARFHGTTTYLVRRKLPPLSLRQIGRLPETLRAEHADWVTANPRQPSAQERRERARLLALSLLEIGEEREAVEAQLHRWQFHPALAHDAMRWALQRHAADQREPVIGKPVAREPVTGKPVTREPVIREQ